MPFATKFPTIMLVDDDPAMREAMEEALLSVAEVRLVHANDGREALNKFGNEEINAIISDVNMPRLKGDDLVQKLLRSQKEVPIFMLSGSIDHEVIKKIRGRVQKAFVKPVDPKEVAREVISHLKKAS